MNAITEGRYRVEKLNGNGGVREGRNGRIYATNRAEWAIVDPATSDVVAGGFIRKRDAVNRLASMIAKARGIA